MRAKWPFYFLKVGEEAFIPDLSWLQNRAYKHAAATGKVFRTRRCGDSRRVKRVA